MAKSIHYLWPIRLENPAFGAAPTYINIQYKGVPPGPRSYLDCTADRRMHALWHEHRMRIRLLKNVTVRQNTAIYVSCREIKIKVRSTLDALRLSPRCCQLWINFCQRSYSEDQEMSQGRKEYASVLCRDLEISCENNLFQAAPQGCFTHEACLVSAGPE